MNTEQRTTKDHGGNMPAIYSKFKGAFLDIILDVAVVYLFFYSLMRILFRYVIPFPELLYMPSIKGENTVNSKVKQEEDIEDNAEGLFPTITNTKLGGEMPYMPSPGSPQPCSTGLTTRLLPFKNLNGEIEWTFTDDIEPGTELDCFKMAPADEKPSSKDSVNDGKADEQEQLAKLENELSPMSSNSSNNESILSNEKNKKKDKEETPMTTNSSPYMSSDHDEYKSKSDEDGENKSYHCPHCDAVFKIRGYLTRHIKKHAVNKAYSCPFHKFSIYIDENNITHKCHPTGGFSRRDTYKTHLKSRHFKYPKGTKTKDRSSTPGNCSMCGEYFQNSEIWCEIHIEGAECKYLPTGFKGKSIIKNRLKKQMSKQRAKKVDYQNIDSSKLFQTPTSNTSQTPILLMDGHLMSYDYASNSPNFSIRSGNVSNTNLATDSVTPISHVQNNGTPIYYNQLFQLPTPHLQQQQQQQQQQYQQKQQQQQIQETQQRQDLLMFDQFKPHKNILHDPQQNMFEDYDDEFCLDIDQLNKASFNNYNELLSYLPHNEPHQQHVHY